MKTPSDVAVMAEMIVRRMKVLRKTKTPEAREEMTAQNEKMRALHWMVTAATNEELLEHPDPELAKTPEG